jgi:hypothetical protein
MNGLALPAAESPATCDLAGSARARATNSVGATAPKALAR